MPNKRGVTINGGVRRSLLNNKQGGQNNRRGGGWVGISKYQLISVTNEKKDINA